MTFTGRLMEYNTPIRYRAERLPNGLILCFDYCTKSASLFNADGTVRSGYPDKAKRDYVRFWRHGMTR